MSRSESNTREAFRLAMRGLGASVTIISTELAHVRYGMVATAAMSVSMDPPSMVVAVNQSASIHEPLLARRAFAVNILTEWDRQMVTGFAKATGEDRFANGPWSSEPVSDGERPLPFLANALASVFCDVKDVFSSGTHSLFVGKVYRVIRREDLAPLLYCDGNYGSFRPIPATAPRTIP
jgi:flavin reductase